jgi:hypothetical protein
MITVQLTPLEAAGWEYSQNMESRNAVRDFVFLKFVSQNVNRDEAHEMAENLADAGERARVKIREATKFEIQIVAE